MSFVINTIAMTDFPVAILESIWISKRQNVYFLKLIIQGNLKNIFCQARKNPLKKYQMCFKPHYVYPVDYSKGVGS